MSRAIMILQQEHKSLTKLLDLMGVLSEEMDAGQVADTQLLQEIGDYLSGYPEAVHHPKEDLIFRHLQQTAPDAIKPGVDLVDEHEQLTSLIESFVTALRNDETEAESQGPTIAAATRELVEAYRHHMEMEEKHFFPTSMSNLTANDWAEIDYVVSEQNDPLFDAASTKYARLRDEIFRLAKVHEDSSNSTESSRLSELAAIATVNDLNAVVKAWGLTVKMIGSEDGGYQLVEDNQVLLDIPKCSEKRASWCAYCFVSGRFSR